MRITQNRRIIVTENGAVRVGDQTLRTGRKVDHVIDHSPIQGVTDRDLILMDQTDILVRIIGADLILGVKDLNTQIPLTFRYKREISEVETIEQEILIGQKYATDASGQAT